MKIFIKVKTVAKHNAVKKIDNSHYAVSVKEPPIQGKANQAIIKTLAKYFGVKKSNIKIISGLTSKQKIVEIF